MKLVEDVEPTPLTTAALPSPMPRLWWRLLRYGSALLITAIVMPVAFVAAVVQSAVAVITFWWLIDVAFVGIVAICVRGLRIGSSRIWQAGALLLAIAAWGRGCFSEAPQYLGGSAPPELLFVAFLAASLWHFWLAWMAFWPTTWRCRLAILALLGLAPLGFWAMFIPEGITGDEKLSFRLRFAPPKTSARHVRPLPGPEAGGELTAITGEDFPQYLGPERNARVRGTKLARDWSLRPPQVLWRIPVGEGWCGFALVGDLAITQEQRDDKEAVVAYHLATGRERWIHLYPARYDSADSVASGTGPRATPTVSDGRVYTMGATGHLCALDLQTGAIVWSKATGEPSGGELQAHGASASPLIIDQFVVVCPSTDQGSVLAAYDRENGDLVWKTQSKGSGYSSPIVAELCDERAILHLDAKGLNAYRIADGTVAWSFAWQSTDIHIAQPLLGAGAPDQILLTSIGGGGAVLLTVRPDASGVCAPRAVWESTYLKSKFSTPVVLGQFVYGLDNGILACLDLSSGKLRWKKGRYHHGQVLLVEELLIVLSEEGTLVLIDPQPNGLSELGSVPALTGKSWNTLALKGNLLVARNATEAVCFRLAVSSDKAQASRPETTSP